MKTTSKLDYCHEWLSIHNVEILGLTKEHEGFCVVDHYTHPLGNFSQTEWLPANINVLRDWMGY